MNEKGPAKSIITLGWMDEMDMNEKGLAKLKNHQSWMDGEPMLTWSGAGEDG